MEQTSVDLQIAARADDGDLKRSLLQALSSLSAFDNETFNAIRDALLELEQRLESGLFRLAVLGQFKRGKSTLINALLGSDLLPTDILPLTAVPTFIKYGTKLRICVSFKDGRNDSCYDDHGQGRDSLESFLAQYVTEKGNPDNRYQVSRVTIAYPASILNQGVVLIDTPGIGSTYQHNTEVAYQVLPQCDAALFLVSPDPPITAVELEYLRDIREQLPRTFFLLNKIDFINAQERIASLEFLAEQLTPLLGGAPQILAVSARQGLQARQDQNEEQWRDSGLAMVERSLIDFFAREKQQTLNASLRSRIDDQLELAQMQLQLTLQALSLSEEELQHRIDAFQAALPDIERERTAARDVMAGDLRRILSGLQVEVEKARAEAGEQVTLRVEALIGALTDSEDLERRVKNVLDQELPRFFTPQMERISDYIKVQGTALLSDHQQRTNRLIEQVRINAAQLFDIPWKAPSAVESYSELTPPPWSHELFTSDMDPVGQKLARRFLTQKYRYRKTAARLREATRKMISQNVEQINWTLRQGVEESFRQFGARLDEQLDGTINSTRAAMGLAADHKEDHSRETAAQKEQLRQVLAELQGISQNMCG